MALTGQNGPLRVALAGYGLAGATFHAPLIAATDGLELAAVVTRSEERRAQLREEYPDVAAVDALGDALDGVDVVVDKPLAVRADEARSVAAAARERGVVLSVFHNRRWDDDYLTLEREIAAGRFGRVLRVESRFDRWRPQIREGAWREAGDPEDGGGLLLDLGSHLVDQVVGLFGRPTTVYAELDVRRPGAVVEDDVFLALEHVGGVRSHLWAGVHAADGPPRFRALGEQGTFVSYGLDQQEATLRAGGRPGDPGFGFRDVAAVGGAAWHDGSGGAAPIALERGRWDGFYAGVVAAIGEGVAPPVTAEQAVGVLEILEAARQSAARGVVVALG